MASGPRAAMALLALPQDVLAAHVLTHLEYKHVAALARSRRGLRDACEEYYERAKAHMASVVAMFAAVSPTGATLAELLDRLRNMGLFEPFVRYRHYIECRRALRFTIVVREYNVQLDATCRVACAVRTQYRSFYMTMYKGKYVTCLYENDLRNLVCDRVVVRDALEDAAKAYNEHARRPAPRITAP